MILRGRRDVSPRQDAMKEVCSLRRGWAGGSASLSSPARRIVETHNDRLDRRLLSRALCPYPTICRLWVACSSRVARSPVAFLVVTLR